VAQKHQAVLAYVTGGSLKTVAFDAEEDSPCSGYAKLRVLNAASSELAGADVCLVDKACSARADSRVYTLFLLGDAGGTVAAILRADR